MKTKKPKGLVEIPFLPGRWIDFSDLNHICVREADGTFVAGDLHVTEEDAEKLKRAWLDYLASLDDA